MTLEEQELHAEPEDGRAGYGDPCLPNLSGLIPGVPFIPDPEPTIARVVFDYQQLKEYRLMSAPYIVQVHYDLVHQMVEDGIDRMHVKRMLDWSHWVEANL